MLWFVDETWQEIGGQRVGALGAVVISASVYNAFCREVYSIKASVLGASELTDSEFKANNCFAKAAFKRHALHGDSHWIDAANQFFATLAKYGARCFVIWTANPALLDLRNPSSTALSKPYKQLLFDMRAYMRKDGKGELGSIMFDERGFSEDEATARAVSNYLVRTSHPAAHDWEKRFLMLPSFAASKISPGLQAADVIAYLGAHRSDMTVRPELAPYHALLNELRYEYRRGGGKKIRCIRKVN